MTMAWHVPILSTTRQHVETTVPTYPPNIADDIYFVFHVKFVKRT